MEWKLSELSVDGKGHYGIGAPAIPYDKNKPTYLRITDINDDGTINFLDLKSVDDEDSNKYLLKENDIVFARTGNSTGRSYFYQKEHGDFVYAGFLIKFSIDPQKVNPKILKYYTHSQEYYNWVKSFDTGGTRGNINAKTFGDMPISLPKRCVQDKIAGILSALDSKIENNNKINANLEAQAQALFKSWFVDFTPFKDQPFVDSELGPIPQGWKVGTLGDIANIIMGQSPAGSSYNERGNGVIFYQGRTEFGFRFPNVRLYTTMPKRYAEPMSILLSVRAPVGDINVAIEKCCIGRGLASISSKRGLHSFLLYLVKSLKNRLEVFNGEGTVFGSINKNTLTQFKIIIPPIEMQEKFNEIIQRHDCMVLELHKEIINLSTQRDTLLPKLMSGEIKL